MTGFGLFMLCFDAFCWVFLLFVGFVPSWVRCSALVCLDALGLVGEGKRGVQMGRDGIGWVGERLERLEWDGSGTVGLGNVGTVGFGNSWVGRRLGWGTDGSGDGFFPELLGRGTVGFADYRVGISPG